MKHLLSLESLTGRQIEEIIDLAARLKKERGTEKAAAEQPLLGQTWAMIFEKASTRTRVSFEVGVRELGGSPFFMGSQESQLGRGEPIEDTARVLGRMVHGIIIRTFEQEKAEVLARLSGVPVINALTDHEHPCQVLADLLTIREKLGTWAGKKVVFVGDGNNNMTRSWMWAAERLDFDLVIAAPADGHFQYRPTQQELSTFISGRISCEADPKQAVSGAHVLYTDVFCSMGQEQEKAKRWQDLADYQLNHELVKKAAPGALVMHCLPAYRGVEITADLLEEHADTIFQEAENRLHAQKAVLALIAKK
jgi:ornithine carbamoyltransferase